MKYSLGLEIFLKNFSHPDKTIQRCLCVCAKILSLSYNIPWHTSDVEIFRKLKVVNYIRKLQNLFKIYVYSTPVNITMHYILYLLFIVKIIAIEMVRYK